MNPPTHIKGSHCQNGNICCCCCFRQVTSALCTSIAFQFHCLQDFPGALLRWLPFPLLHGSFPIARSSTPSPASCDSLHSQPPFQKWKQNSGSIYFMNRLQLLWKCCNISLCFSRCKRIFQMLTTDAQTIIFLWFSFCFYCIDSKASVWDIWLYRV